MKWLWLEDNISSVMDITDILRKNSINFECFETPNSLSKFINDNQDKVANYGFIIDIMLSNQYYITRTKELSDKETDFKTNDGYDAGLIYINEIICGEKKENEFIFKKIPPIICLSVRSSESKEVNKVIDEIKNKIVEINGILKSEVSLEWIRKWDVSLDPDKFIETIKKLENK